jgi:hypothetical protein
LPRLLNEKNRQVYARFVDVIPSESRAAFLRQLDELEIIRQDSSHTTFHATSAANPIDDHAIGGILDGFYDDEDGDVISIIIHFVDGYISWAERFRTDTMPVRKVLPDPSEIRFSMQKA